MDTVDMDTGEVFEPNGSYRRSEEIAELFTALAKAQGQFEMAERIGENEGFKRGGKASTYATLASAIEATKKGCSENGLAIVQMPSNGTGNNIAVTTLLGHTSGQWLESTFGVAPQQFTAQGAGSVITYLRRYTLMAILGIAPEDDDGNAAVAAPQAIATRMTPAVAKTTVSKDVAIAIASRIRSEIKAARSTEDLNRTGIFGANAAADYAAIRTQDKGENVWKSFVDADAARRKELLALAPDQFKPISDLASDLNPNPVDRDYRI